MEWLAMMRCVAYVLFVLACVLPGWYLRDIVAAEAQIQRYSPTPRWFGPLSAHRKLGPDGVAYLFREYHGDDNSDRWCRASTLLYENDEPSVAKGYIDMLTNPTPPPSVAAYYWLMDSRHGSGVRAYLLRLREEDIPGVLCSLRNSIAPGALIWALWCEQPALAERVATRWVRETRDAQAVGSGFWTSSACAGALMWSEPFGQFGWEVLTTGSQNPNHDVREQCAQWLASWDRFRRSR